MSAIACTVSPVIEPTDCFDSTQALLSQTHCDDSQGHHVIHLPRSHPHDPPVGGVHCVHLKFAWNNRGRQTSRCSEPRITAALTERSGDCTPCGAVEGSTETNQQGSCLISVLPLTKSPTIHGSTRRRDTTHSQSSTNQRCRPHLRTPSYQGRSIVSKPFSL